LERSGYCRHVVLVTSRRADYGAQTYR
jgi:hypothetical protein